jgi:hypothetical protein
MLGVLTVLLQSLNGQAVPEEPIPLTVDKVY